MENNSLNDEKEDIPKIDCDESNSGSPSEVDYPEVLPAVKSVYIRTPGTILLQEHIRDNIFAFPLSIFAFIFLFYNAAAFCSESTCHRRTQELMFGIGLILFVFYLRTRCVRKRFDRARQGVL